MRNTTKTARTDISEALQALARVMSLQWEFKPCTDLDALVVFITRGKPVEIGIEFKRHVRRSILGQLSDRLASCKNRYSVPVVLCTEYVEPKLAAALKAAGIQFFDKAGNAYLDLEGLFTYVQGQPKPASVHKREKSGRAFQSAGLRLVFQLIRQPELAARPYRELAELAGISLSAVKRAVDDLSDKGFIGGGNKQRRLQQTRRLLDEWCVAYRDRLRPQLVRGRYEAPDPEWWQKVDMESISDAACWGSEVAAAKLDLMRRPQVHTIYTSGNINALMAAGRLRRQDDGNVEVLEMFWRDAGGDIAPDLIIYADLITSGIERNMETAKVLYAQRIENRFT